MAFSSKLDAPLRGREILSAESYLGDTMYRLALDDDTMLELHVEDGRIVPRRRFTRKPAPVVTTVPVRSR